MKTRLLKKVRKRYSITRVDKLASNASYTNMMRAKEYGLPFYRVEDDESFSGFRTRCFKTFEESREYICGMILEDYKEKFRHKDGKSTKVWFVSK